jgi:hypothetical protein
LDYKWDHFLISKKANFVSSAADEDSMYDKVYVLDFAIPQFFRFFYETEVGAKAMSAGSFNLYLNLSKTLTLAAKELLKDRTTDDDHEFSTTDAMKTVLHVLNCIDGSGIAVEQVVLPQSVQSWFHEHLENFDTSQAAIECCIQLVRDTAGLLLANPAYIP